MMTHGIVWHCPHTYGGCGQITDIQGKRDKCLADVDGWTALRRLEEIMKARLTKPKDAQRKDQAPQELADKAFEGSHPHVFAFMAQTRWEDNTIRETGTLTVFVQDGTWKMAINDRDANRSAFIAAANWTQLLATLEEKLEDGTLDWRAKK